MLSPFLLPWSNIGQTDTQVGGFSVCLFLFVHFCSYSSHWLSTLFPLYFRKGSPVIHVIVSAIPSSH